MGDGSRSVLREAAIRCGLVLMGIAVSLPMAECVVRISGAAPDVILIRKGRFRLSPNPKIGYEPAPAGRPVSNSLDFHDYLEPSNSLGYRDSEHAIAKLPGIFRIVLLGDSVGAGLLVHDRAQTFPKILERLLRDEDIHAEVINLSVSGYNTQQEIETLRERGLAYSPDVVLLQYCLNDRGLDGGGIIKELIDLEMRAEGIPRARILSPLLAKSALYRFLRYTVLPRRGAEATRHRDFLIGQVSADGTEEYLAELGRLAREHGFEALVVIFPHLQDFADYQFGYEHRRMARLAHESGLWHVDLFDTFRECRETSEGPIAFDRFHPTPAGHHCAAVAIANHIRFRILGIL